MSGDTGGPCDLKLHNNSFWTKIWVAVFWLCIAESVWDMGWSEALVLQQWQVVNWSLIGRPSAQNHLCCTKHNCITYSNGQCLPNSFHTSISWQSCEESKTSIKMLSLFSLPGQNCTVNGQMHQWLLPIFRNTNFFSVNAAFVLKFTNSNDQTHTSTSTAVSSTPIRASHADDAHIHIFTKAEHAAT